MGTPALQVTCDRWQDCQRQIAEACDRLDCPHRDQHPMITKQLKDLEAREEKQDTAILGLQGVAGSIQQELAGIRGEIRGALVASKISGSVIGAVVTAAISLGAMFVVKR